MALSCREIGLPSAQQQQQQLFGRLPFSIRAPPWIYFLMIVNNHFTLLGRMHARALNFFLN